MGGYARRRDRHILALRLGPEGLKIVIERAIGIAVNPPILARGQPRVADQPRCLPRHQAPASNDQVISGNGDAIAAGNRVRWASRTGSRSVIEARQAAADIRPRHPAARHGRGDMVDATL